MFFRPKFETYSTAKSMVEPSVNGDVLSLDQVPDGTSLLYL